MPVTTPDRPLVTITIPADCLEDFRAAMVREIASDTECRREDHAGATRSLAEDSEILHQLPYQATTIGGC